MPAPGRAPARRVSAFRDVLDETLERGLRVPGATYNLTSTGPIITSPSLRRSSISTCASLPGAYQPIDEL